jgi:hypothetical protein
MGLNTVKNATIVVGDVAAATATTSIWAGAGAAITGTFAVVSGAIAGFFTGTIGFIGIIYGILGRIFLPAYWVTGWTALFVGIMFLGGVQLITIGIIGEYMSKIYKEVQKRPQYLIKEKINI